MVAGIAVVFVIPAYMVLLVKLLPRSPLGRRIFLGRAPKAEAEATPEADRHESLVGQEGVAETTLRPSGAIRIGGRRVIATAETGLIEQGAAVRVVRAVGMNVVVRRAES
jgi:membrane-bound serine protease (ClpP class)